MREKMAAMQRQIEQFVRTLNEELAIHVPTFEPPEHTSLIPVITLPSAAPARGNRKEARKK